MIVATAPASLQADRATDRRQERIAGPVNTHSICDLMLLPESIEIAGASYHFSQPMRAFYDPHIRVFQVLELPFISGHGLNEKTARRDWALCFHAAFQKLLFTRDFELDDKERERKLLLQQKVDVTRYMNTVPQIVQKVGRIDQARAEGSYPTRITWLDGRHYAIDYDRADIPKLARMVVGQWLDAQLRIHPKTNEVLELLSVRAIKRPDVGAENLLEQVPRVEAPESDRSWT
jgi:hypothetical protein